MRILAIAAAALLIAGAAYAGEKNDQAKSSAVPESHQTGTPTTSGLATPGQPGSGYKAPEKANANGPATRNGDLPKGGKNKQ